MEEVLAFLRVQLCLVLSLGTLDPMARGWTSVFAASFWNYYPKLSLPGKVITDY